MMTTFPIYDEDGALIEGASPAVSAYVDAAGAPQPAPTVEEMGGGMYGLDVAADRAYLIDCGEDAEPRYVSGGTGGLVAFGLFDDEGEPWAGDSPAFQRYDGDAPEVLTLASGLFGFVPSTADRLAAASYLIAAPEGAAPAHYSGAVPPLPRPSAVGPRMLVGGRAGGTFTLKQGSLLPSLLLQVVDRAGAPVDLTGRDLRLIVTTRPGRPPIVDASAILEDPAAGLARYDWQPGDTDAPGTYRIEAVVTDADGAPLVLPGSGYGILVIERALKP